VILEQQFTAFHCGQEGRKLDDRERRAIHATEKSENQLQFIQFKQRIHTDAIQFEEGLKSVDVVALQSHNERPIERIAAILIDNRKVDWRAGGGAEGPQLRRKPKTRGQFVRTARIAFVCDLSGSGDGTITGVSETSPCHCSVQYHTPHECAAPNITDENLAVVSCVQQTKLN
jgi:hypothetical protein